MTSETRKVCFNVNCKVFGNNFRRGWRCRTGDYAYLCDCCATAYEDGKFCETFHLNDSGWRCCEVCRKKIHCGCIVSFHMFVLLDAGGIECLTCARKSYILTPNPAWPPPSHFIPSLPERMKDVSVNNWSHIAGSGPLPWRQAPSLFRQSDFDSDVKEKHPFDFDVLGGFDRSRSYERLSTAPLEMKQGVPIEIFANRKLKTSSFKILGNFEAKELPNSLEHRLISTSEKPDSQLVASGEGERGNGCAQNNFLPQQGLEITEKLLQQISDKAKVTPLFEKMLSASDAGRIGRLVLPKKCAEAYFPPITCPEGLPLRVMDVKGKEWIFQFRFWPNNNSRMYVLEGINPCIQSLQLQAGDIVIFSRLEPEGKLIMGGRKTAASHSVEKGADYTMASTVTLASGVDCAKKKNGVSISVNDHAREKILEDATIIHAKKKSRNSNANNSRLELETENKFSFTLKEAQKLMRPPSKVAPSIIVIEGYEFEEFEGDALVIGRPTIPGTDHSGENIQWIECEQCCKWRKVPADAILASGWICSENEWDSSRSLCSATEELSREQIEEMLQSMETDYTKKEGNSVKQVSDISLALEGHDELANMATQSEGNSVPAQSERTSKHPHDKFGCYQPQIENVSGHRPSCHCAHCFMRRSWSRAIARMRQEHCERGIEPPLPVIENGNSSLIQEETSRGRYHNEVIGTRSLSSPMKSQIDLNMKPEREEELWILDS